MVKENKKIGKKQKVIKTTKMKLKQEETKENPDLKHYILAVFIIFGVFLAIYLIDLGYDNYTENKETERKIKELENRFKHNYVEFNGKVLNMEFFIPFSKLEDLNYKVDFEKKYFSKFKNISFIVIDYNVSEKKKGSGYQVLKSTSRLLVYLSYVFDFELNKNLFFSGNYYPNYTCENSTKENNLIIFNTNAKTNEIKFNKENYCLEFLSKSPRDMVYVGDSFFLNMASN
jgi:hypothetical protein